MQVCFSIAVTPPNNSSIIYVGCYDDSLPNDFEHHAGSNDTSMTSYLCLADCHKLVSSKQLLRSLLIKFAKLGISRISCGHLILQIAFLKTCFIQIFKNLYPKIL